MRAKHRKKQRFSPVQAFAVGRGEVSLFCALPVLHVRCDGAVEAEYCKEILQYTQEMISLDMGKISAEIVGDGLVLETLQKNRMTIHGRIFEIRFHYEKVQEKQ